MTKCEQLQKKIDECITKAMNTTNGYLKTFYANAAYGFKRKLETMTVEELTKRV